MKKKNLWIIALVTIITIGIIGCGGNDDPPPPEKFTVTFIANGGTPEPQAQTVEKGSKVTEPATMTKNNCSFSGWYKENTFSNLWNFAIDTVTAEIELYAKWICNCNPKEHLGIGEMCDCGGTSCTCTLKVYGEIGGDEDCNLIKIYRNGNVSDADMNTATNVFTITYNAWGKGEKMNLNGKLDEIHILEMNPNTTGYTYANIGGKKVLGVFIDYAEYSGYLLEQIRDDGITID